MKTPERQSLTLEYCRARLLEEMKMWHFVFLWMLPPVMLGSLALGIGILRETIRYFSKLEELTVLNLPYGAWMALAALILFLCCAFCIVGYIRIFIGDYDKIKKGKLYFVEDTLSYTVREPVRRGRHIEYEEIFYFSNVGRYNPSELMTQLVEREERFYILMLGGKSPRPLEIYPSKMYALQGTVAMTFSGPGQASAQ